MRGSRARRAVTSCSTLALLLERGEAGEPDAARSRHTYYRRVELMGMPDVDERPADVRSDHWNLVLVAQTVGPWRRPRTTREPGARKATSG